MPDTPKYDPSKIVNKSILSISNSSNTGYNANKIVSKTTLDKTNISPIGKLEEQDPNIPKTVYQTPRELEINKTLDFIQQESKRNLRDDEKDILKNMMLNPYTKKEELSDAIVTFQGKKAKQIGNSWTTPDYYMKRNENGNYVPVALKQGEQIPSGYKAASVWGTQASANDDSWYTDLGKSLGNGVFGAIGGVIDLAQVGTTLATGKESETLRAAKNSTEALKFNKDEELNTPIFNTEGVKEWSDLLDIHRFDVSPKALWGTLNMAAESFTEFGLGAKGAGTAIKGFAALRSGLKGVEEVGALSSAARKSAIFTGSFMTQLGDNLDNAQAIGLEGRDKAAVASVITAPMAALDAVYGLDGKIMNSLFQKSKKELMRNLIGSIDRDAAGRITEQGFRYLAAQTTLQYGQLAKTGVKEIAKDALKEGTQEAAQEYAKRSGEELWDKLSPDDKGKFGTDAHNAKSFGEYINNFSMGLVSGIPMGSFHSLRKQHNEQSENAFNRVIEGPEAVNALKTDLTNLLDKGEITEQEHANALFKLDKYQKYNTLSEKYNLTPEQKKRVFELSFQIDGLQTEIPTNTQEIHNLSPIEKADLKSKEEMQKGLQDELNKIILRSDVISEPTVGKKTEEKIAKEDEKALEENIGNPESKPTEKPSTNSETKPTEKIPTKRKALTEIASDHFNKLSSLGRKQIVQEHLKKTPNKAIQGFIEEGQNGKLHVNIGEDKYLTFAQSVKPTSEDKTENIRRENLPATVEKGKIVTKNGQIATNEAQEPLTSYKEPVNVQRQEIDEYTEEGKQVFNEDGTPKKKAVLNVFNGQTGKYIISIREKDKQAGRNYQSSEYSPKEIEQLNALQDKGFQIETKTEIVNKHVEKPKPTEKTKEKETIKPEENKGLSQDEIANIQDSEVRKAAEIEYIMKNIFGKVGEAAANKIKEYADRIKKGENKESVLSGLPKSFVEGINELLNTLESKPIEETKPIPVENKPEKKAIKTVDEVIVGDRVSDIGGKKGTVTKIEDGKITLKLDNGATYSANPKVVDLFKENPEEKLQKESNKKGSIEKTVEVLQKAMPKIQFIYNDKLEAAGRFIPSKNTIEVNPNYAGLDTPIHEAGHVLIDAIGYSNKAIQSAIKQLKNTALYSETKERYPELSEEELDKEVLAEAIGREGADIFDNMESQSKFKQYLDYIFDWLKTKLGINKNIAKSLAKQIISGINTKKLKGTETGKEQLQKKGKLKILTYTQYRSSKLRSFDQEEKDIASAEDIINDDNSSQEEIDKAEKTLTNIRKIRSEDTKSYRQYKADATVIQEIIEAKDLSKYSTEDLIGLFNQIKNFEFKAKETLMKDVMLRIATSLHKQGKDRIMAEHSSYIESLADTKDIKPGQVWLLHGSHFSEYQPEMQEAYKIIQEAQLNKIKESNEKKAINEELAKRVITERNKQLGIVEKGKSILPFNSDSAKYFEYMDNGKGQLLTAQEAENKGLSKVQKDYLDFTRKTLVERNDLITADDYANAEMDVIRVDKKFSESFKQDGLTQAFSYYLGGGGSNLGNVRIMYKGQPTEFKNIEKDIISNTKKGDVVGNIKALLKLIYYNVAAKRQLNRGQNIDERANPLELLGNAEYSLNQNGQLTSKFDRARTKDRGYSKDFYRAMIEFIDDTTHVKHINPILAIIDSVETLNRDGYIQQGIAIKPNVAKWIEEFKALHIFKEPKVSLDPAIDITLKFFRQLTAASTMWFNIPANAINVAMGNYNSWRQENSAVILKGNKRLFGKKGVDPYSLDIIQKYSIVNQDFDSNPKVGFGKIFSTLSTIGTAIGEYQIQGSLALGLMSEEDYNSFEYKEGEYGIKQLVVKQGVDEKALNERMIGYKNRVTDIQGKYPDEDRRNIMRPEWAKAVFQFKVWMPDWFKERFAAQYINSRNEVKEGTFTQFFREGYKQIYADLKKGDIKSIMQNKVFMSNLKGLMSIGALLALKYQDDDDERRRKKASLVQNTLGQLLFIMDPEQTKYTLSNPVAALGKMKDMVSAIQSLSTLETNKKGDYMFDDKILRVAPAGKLIKAGVSAVSE